MEKTYAVYRWFESHAEPQENGRVVLMKFSQDFETEKEAVNHLEENTDLRGGDYMILASYYKHEPDN